MRSATLGKFYAYDDDMAKNKAAQALGRKGGKARAQRLTKAERSASARKAAQARWQDKDKAK